jgi:hypothetical protein
VVSVALKDPRRMTAVVVVHFYHQQLSCNRYYVKICFRVRPQVPVQPHGWRRLFPSGLIRAAGSSAGVNVRSLCLDFVTLIAWCLGTFIFAK